PPAGAAPPIPSGIMNFGGRASASTRPSASGVSRPFLSTEAARSTRYAPPWPRRCSQSVPISYRYQRRNAKKGTRWHAGVCWSDRLVCPGFARTKTDHGGEDEREGRSDEEAGPNAGGRGDDTTEERAEAEAQ